MNLSMMHKFPFLQWSGDPCYLHWSIEVFFPVKLLGLHFPCGVSAKCFEHVYRLVLPPHNHQWCTFLQLVLQQIFHGFCWATNIKIINVMNQTCINPTTLKLVLRRAKFFQQNVFPLLSVRGSGGLSPINVLFHARCVVSKRLRTHAALFGLALLTKPHTRSTIRRVA